MAFLLLEQTGHLVLEQGGDLLLEGTGVPDPYADLILLVAAPSVTLTTRAASVALSIVAPSLNLERNGGSS